jgi:hypothetical protein
MEPDIWIRRQEDFIKTGPIKFHLGCAFEHDPDNTLSMGPKHR